MDDQVLKLSRSDRWFVAGTLAVLLLASLWSRVSGSMNAADVQSLVAATLQERVALPHADLVVYSVNDASGHARVAARLMGRASTLLFERADRRWVWSGIAFDRGPQPSLDEYLQQVRQEDEDAALAAVHAVNTAEVALRIRRGRYANLDALQAERLLVLDLASSSPRGYNLALEADGASYRVTAAPVAYARSGFRSFLSDDSLIVRAADHRGGPAMPDDPECEPKASERGAP